MVDLNPQEKSYYNYLWSIADSDKDGKMPAGDAVQFLRKANLPDQTLGVVRSYMKFHYSLFRRFGVFQILHQKDISLRVIFTLRFASSQLLNLERK